MNPSTLVLIIAGVVAAFFVLILIGLSRNKRTNNRLHLIGPSGSLRENSILKAL